MSAKGWLLKKLYLPLRSVNGEVKLKSRYKRFILIVMLVQKRSISEYEKQNFA